MIEVKQLLLQNNIKVKYNVGFTGMDVLRSPTMFKPWISQLKAFIQHFPGVQLNYRGERAEFYSLQFSYKISRGILIEVDLLVSPYWNRPEDFYMHISEESSTFRITNFLDSL